MRGKKRGDSRFDGVVKHGGGFPEGDRETRGGKRKHEREAKR